MIDVELNISGGKYSMEVVGLPDTAVKESKERVKAAIKNSNLKIPQKRILLLKKKAKSAWWEMESMMPPSCPERI